MIRGLKIKIVSMYQVPTLGLNVVLGAKHMTFLSKQPCQVDMSSPFISCGNRGVKGGDHCRPCISGWVGISSQTRLTLAPLSRALCRPLLTSLPPHSSALSSVLFTGETFSQQCHHLAPRLEKVRDSPGPTHSDSALPILLWSLFS